jgi:hypothetical protein
VITKEITVWCDHETDGITCGQWTQFNEADARGQPSRARRLAKEQAGWQHTRDGKDLCPRHRTDNHRRPLHA